MEKQIVNKYYILSYDLNDHLDDELTVIIPSSNSELKDIIKLYESMGKTNLNLTLDNVRLIILGNVRSGTPYRYVRVSVRSENQDSTSTSPVYDSDDFYIITGESLDMILDYILDTEVDLNSITVGNHQITIYESILDKNGKEIN